MKCTGERVVRFLVCLQVVRPFPVISTVLRSLDFTQYTRVRLPLTLLVLTQYV